jgi:hypothetical protein
MPDDLPLYYLVLQYLTDLPVNIWLWMVPFAAPLAVFGLSHDSGAWARFIRLILAIGVSYVLLLFLVLNYHHLQAVEHQACQSSFADGYKVLHPECGDYFYRDGAQNAFALLFGWIPAVAYVGFWELVWRIRHRHKIQQLGATFKGKWYSTILIVCSVPVWSYVLLLFSRIFILLWLLVTVWILLEGP